MDDQQPDNHDLQRLTGYERSVTPPLNSPHERQSSSSSLQDRPVRMATLCDPCAALFSGEITLDLHAPVMSTVRRKSIWYSKSEPTLDLSDSCMLCYRILQQLSTHRRLNLVSEKMNGVPLRIKSLLALYFDGTMQLEGSISEPETLEGFVAFSYELCNISRGIGSKLLKLWCYLYELSIVAFNIWHFGETGLRADYTITICLF